MFNYRIENKITQYLNESSVLNGLPGMDQNFLRKMHGRWDLKHNARVIEIKNKTQLNKAITANERQSFILIYIPRKPENGYALQMNKYGKTWWQLDDAMAINGQDNKILQKLRKLQARKIADFIKFAPQLGTDDRLYFVPFGDFTTGGTRTASRLEKSIDEKGYKDFMSLVNTILKKIFKEKEWFIDIFTKYSKNLGANKRDLTYSLNSFFDIKHMFNGSDQLQRIIQMYLYELMMPELKNITPEIGKRYYAGDYEYYWSKNKMNPHRHGGPEAAVYHYLTNFAGYSRDQLISEIWKKLIRDTKNKSIFDFKNPRMPDIASNNVIQQKYKDILG